MTVWLESRWTPDLGQPSRVRNKQGIYEGEDIVEAQERMMMNMACLLTTSNDMLLIHFAFNTTILRLSAH